MASLKQYLPSIYRDIQETDAITESEDILFDELARAILLCQDNSFIATAGEIGIARYEDLLGIIPTPTQTLQFRRERLLNRFSSSQVFTMRTLESLLNSSIGVGTWEAYMDENQPYTLVVESSASNQEWYEELLITINSSKPANIVFINKPLVNSQLSAGESISYSERLWNYRLGTRWELGALPFVSYHNKGEHKGMTTPSIQPALLNDLAAYTAADVKKVRVNGSVVIIQGITTKTDGNIATIEYVIPHTDSIPQVTQIELLDANDRVLTKAPVYIPAITDLTLKHTIKVKEG